MKEEERGKGGSVNIGGGGDDVTHFGEAVHNGEDGILAVVSHGENGFKVHGDAFPWFGGDRE